MALSFQKNKVMIAIKSKIMKLASDRLRTEIRARRIKRESCINCGSINHIHGHHPDYRRFFEVIWLCPLCHKKIHNYVEYIELDLETFATNDEMIPITERQLAAHIVDFEKSIRAKSKRYL